MATLHEYYLKDFLDFCQLMRTGHFKVQQKAMFQLRILVDRVGVNWDRGIELVVNKIQQVLVA